MTEFGFGKPSGMYLEPVISSAHEIGCRAMRFIHNLVNGIDGISSSYTNYFFDGNDATNNMYELTLDS
jgi:hypothetical protein